ncbi:MAG: AMP nucleosidase [Micavibrio sp.]|nr:AMP nucleosidase [Micavibrio sp.]
MILTPDIPEAQLFSSADDAFAHVQKLYDEQVDFLQKSFKDFVAGNARENRSRGFYPYVRIKTVYARRADSRFSYGFAPRPGVYSTTLTRPDIFSSYYEEQFRLLIKNHDIPLEIGISTTPIPIHFALGDSFHLEGDLSAEQLKDLPDLFDVPDLDIMDDEIANSSHIINEGDPNPLALFTAPRVDLSIQRLRHYCGMPADHFQNYIIFTNYQFYIDEFVKIGKERVGKDGYVEFVGPDPDKRLPQMPAYHLKMEGNKGITMVNIGVGPSNAKTITDHIAVMRPHAWLMLGHCAGLRNSQELGDYVLAHGYLREDHVLDEQLPVSIPIPALAEVQLALEQAVAEITNHGGYDLKKIMRTGTVATTDDRNWELRSAIKQNKRLSQSRAIAMDMESGTIAANGFRFRVPYGTLLCVSDKPLHGQLKLPGMADTFYRQRVDQHLLVGLRTMELLRDYSPEKLHSRKLRSFDEVAFQ